MRWMGIDLKTQHDFVHSQDYVDYLYHTGRMLSLRHMQDWRYGWHDLTRECDSRTRLILDSFTQTLHDPSVLRVAVVVADLGGASCEPEYQDMLQNSFVRHTGSGMTFSYHMAPTLTVKPTGTVFIIDPGFAETPLLFDEWKKLFPASAGITQKTGIMDVKDVPAFLNPYKSVLDIQPVEEQTNTAHANIARLQRKMG